MTRATTSASGLEVVMMYSHLKRAGSRKQVMQPLCFAH